MFLCRSRTLSDWLAVKYFLFLFVYRLYIRVLCSSLNTKTRAYLYVYHIYVIVDVLDRGNRIHIFYLQNTRVYSYGIVRTRRNDTAVRT